MWAITHLELTTSIGVGGFDRLTPEQQADALGYLIHKHRAPPKPETKGESEHDKRMKRLAAAWGTG